MDKKYFNIIYKIITYSLLLMACTYHMYTVWKLYLSYKTTTNVKYVSNKYGEEIYPSISLCFDIGSAIKQNIWNNLSRDSLREHTIGEQFKFLSTPNEL